MRITANKSHFSTVYCFTRCAPLVKQSSVLHTCCINNYYLFQLNLIIIIWISEERVSKLLDVFARDVQNHPVRDNVTNEHTERPHSPSCEQN